MKKVSHNLLIFAILENDLERHLATSIISQQDGRRRTATFRAGRELDKIVNSIYRYEKLAEKNENILDYCRVCIICQPYENCHSILLYL